MKKIILILLFGLFSCDKFTTYTMSIDNRTDDTIMVLFSGETKGPNNLTFPPKTNKMFRNYEGIQVRNYCSSIWIVEGGVEVTTSSGRKLQKKMWDADNWECSGSNKAGWARTFVITEDDLE